MPLFHCKSCHHEWEGAEDTWTCEWCGAQGYVLAPHTALENMLSAMQPDLDGYEPLTWTERDAAIKGQIPPYAQLLGWIRRWEVTIRDALRQGKETQQLAASVRGLADDQLLAALRNVGCDLACGACAELFFTGHPNNDHTCTK